MEKIIPRILVTVIILASLGHASAQGTAFTYQGRLNSGSAVASGSYDLAFTLYGTNVTGVALAGPVTNAATAVSNGLFTVVVDFGNAFTGTSNWLELAVRTNGAASFTTLTPRQQLTPVPYALVAGNISGILASTSLPASVVTNGASITGTFSGNGTGVTNVNAATLGGISSAGFWKTNGNAGANGAFLGTTDNQPLEIKVNGQRALRLEPGGASPNVIGGYAGNSVNGTVYGGFIGGGGTNGLVNQVGSYGSVIGGLGNTASGGAATAAGFASTASGIASFAAGNSAKATNNGAFVWADNVFMDFSSTADNQFLVRAGGGVGINTNNPNGAALAVNGNVIVNGTITGSGAGLNNVPGTLAPQLVPGTSITAQANVSYDLTNTALTSVTLPPTANVGDMVEVSGLGAGGWQVAAAPGVAWVAQENIRFWASVASSADGSKLVAVVDNGQIYTSTDSGVTWTPRENTRKWDSVASSADGSNLVAVVYGGLTYASTDSGVTWFGADIPRQWTATAISADGTKRVAAVNGGQLYTAVNGGGWIARDSNRNWSSVASSADGSKLVAVVGNGQIYTSTDSGVTWTPRDSNRSWSSVASSADGSRLVAVVSNGQIYTSTDSGVTWTPRESTRNWSSVASSADGSKLVAGVYSGQIYTSADSGVTWTPRESQRNWRSVASSSDGNELVAAGDFTKIYTSVSLVTGAQGTSQQFQYFGHGVWQMVVASTVPAASLTGSIPPATLTSVPAANLVGTINDTVLSTNVALREGDNTFTGNQIINSSLTVSGSVIAAGLRLVPDATSPNVIGGFSGNIVSNGFVGGFIGGGGQQASGPWPNRVGANYASIVGGYNNTASGLGATAMGVSAIASGTISTAIGYQSTASGDNSFSAGYQTLASGVGSTAMGYYARAVNDGAFVWGDTTVAFLPSTNANSVTMRAAGGYRLFSNGGATAGVFLASGGTAWAVISDRNAKKDFAPINAVGILEKLAAMPVTQWHYKWETTNTTPHIGPMAQDFKAAFYPGTDDKSITTLEADGVAFAAIQGLNQKLEAQKSENAELKRQLAELKVLVQQLAEKK